MSHRILLRRISTLSSAATKTPYLLLGKEVIGNSPCGGKLVNYNLYDPRNEEQVKIENQILPKNLCSSSSTVGSSRGWLAMMNKQDSIINLINIFNNNNNNTISLPPLIKDETERLLNVSVSSSPNEDEEEEEDCLVAVRFHGSRLDLCRLSNPEWIRIDVPCTPAFGLSPVMYSDKDGKFYLNSRSVDYIGHIDFKSKSGLVAPVSGYVRYPFSNFHELENHLRFFPSPNVQQLLVQSPSGESLVVLWDMNLLEREDKIMVFKENKENGKSEYVTEINDLCIFIGLGDNEPFCLSASEYPGLQPNSVYFAGYCSTFGVYDLASNTIRYLCDKPRYLSPHSRLFWLPPTRSIMDSPF